MRTSKRTQILEAAARVVEREGVKSVTFDSVAAEAGLTKGGLLYHFTSREDLVQAIHQHLADQWEAQMTAAAGRPAREASPTERLTAYTRVTTHSATRAELLFMLEGSTTPEHAAPWGAVMERWAPPSPTTDAGDPVALDRFIARLAADGLWLYESLTAERLTPELRRALAERITSALDHEDK
ncbi:MULTISPECIES: TetR/AcrR family transcriptional regulator [Streptomyces]|uniref:AcrR family transcriptional regulator n=1 Tax=Streptomyces clavifer TaxID=68188 RepID=A0ABS4VEN4_9ACTN|nr:MULTISPECIES: TetR/AcrR family transcriptional regulator [Streptomyces]KQX89811.1 TetR family transcriptional regulator [Streptomyces sp. Root1319]KQZ20495.1 TetR family transcriptional regulator [Streptomyces sp. Root55]MBP2362384.1 AcrR family transcriptional regulator [Streptomyces clavifer]MDX2745414.1 TetR/AcrR family transcriptional regulator [Streptomyces sp. NRRL_B-2557]MDX3067888.1 TetR/AcrR family transcriptional regulator [Streptomyces sp. ND04-05B]